MRATSLATLHQEKVSQKLDLDQDKERGGGHISTSTYRQEAIKPARYMGGTCAEYKWIFVVVVWQEVSQSGDK